jgi:hypothetical protein
MGPAGKMLSDLVEIRDFDARIPIFLRIQHDIGTFLAGPEAHVRFYFDIAKPFGGNPLIELLHDFLRAPGFAVDILTDETDPIH